MSGHANEEEIQVVQQLESSIDFDTSPINDLLELGQLYIEPCHREGEAIAIFEAVLRRDPRNAHAKFWLAYCCLHYLMDPDSLRRAADLLESVIQEDPQHAGAAYMLLAEVLDEAGNLPLNRKLQLLEASVHREPGWVFNRQSLAWAYTEAGRYSDALAQLRIALANVTKADPSWSISTRNFEESITGRIGHRVIERLTSDMERVQAAMTQETRQ